MKKLLIILLEIIMWVAIVFWTLFQSLNSATFTRADHIMFFIIDIIIFILVTAYYMQKD